MENGKKYEPETLKQYEKYLRKMGKPVKVLKSGLFVSPSIPILGCSPDAKANSLSWLLGPFNFYEMGRGEAREKKNYKGGAGRKTMKKGGASDEKK